MAIKIIREVNADVVKRGSTRAVYAKQHDVNSRFLNVRIQEDGKDIIVAPHLKVLLNVERSDHIESMFYGTVNEDGTVQVPLTTWMLELAGTLVCDISIVSEDPTVAKLTTMQFNIYVESAVVSDESFVDNTEYSVIVDLLKKTADALDAAEKTELKASDALTAATAAQEAAEGIRDGLLEAKNRGDFDGKSAYDFAKEDGYEGTEEDYAHDVNPDNIQAVVPVEGGQGIVVVTEKDKIIVSTNVIISPTDITAGTTPLEPGQSYHVYS